MPWGHGVGIDSHGSVEGCWDLDPAQLRDGLAAYLGEHVLAWDYQFIPDEQIQVVGLVSRLRHRVDVHAEVNATTGEVRFFVDPGDIDTLR